MPFAATWMDLEIIILSEVSQTKTNTTWCHLYVESKIWRKLIYETDSDIENGLVVAKRGEMDWEFRTCRCKLLYIKGINKKSLLYSTGNYIFQHPIINHNGKEKEIKEKTNTQFSSMLTYKGIFHFRHIRWLNQQSNRITPMWNNYTVSWCSGSFSFPPFIIVGANLWMGSYLPNTSSTKYSTEEPCSGETTRPQRSSNRSSPMASGQSTSYYFETSALCFLNIFEGAPGVPDGGAQLLRWISKLLQKS